MVHTGSDTMRTCQWCLPMVGPTPLTTSAVIPPFHEQCHQPQNSIFLYEKYHQLLVTFPLAMRPLSSAPPASLHQPYAVPCIYEHTTLLCSNNMP